ncbi:MAG TPA: glycerol-3-phosphate 1-O-acyltransferase PlsY [Alphaproteobacteria bacterium]|nr:glycerol-3-phosphate 1-O-acyltransferase PlsY [Alphaproteobacteria bacterium]
MEYEPWALYGAYAQLAVLSLCAYLLGSIPFGLLLTKLAGLGDIRSVGSGNIGATNVLRTGRKGLAALTLILDVVKGIVAVLAAKWIGALVGSAILYSLAAGLAVVIGHVFPVWLKFKGGKGVATTFGVLLALSPASAAVTAATWLFMLLIFRFSSLAALAACVVATFFAFGYAGQSVGLLIGALALLIVVKHQANIVRLIKGTEPKVGK